MGQRSSRTVQSAENKAVNSAGTLAASFRTLGVVDDDDGEEEEDWSSYIPDECLASVFRKLDQADRTHCSLTCKRWHKVDAQTRQRLVLRAHADVAPMLPLILSRFDLLTKLTLRSNRRIPGIDDAALHVIGSRCHRLKKIKLKGCRQLTDVGIENFATACKSPLQKFSIASCNFGSLGVNSILRSFTELDDLSVKRLRGLADGPYMLIDAGAGKIRRLFLKELVNAQLFGPLIAGSKKIHTLMLCKNSGNWDKLLEIVAEHVHNLVELHVERLQFSDRGLQAASKWASLEVLHVAKIPECTDYGLECIADGCGQLKRLRIDGCKSNRIGDSGLASVARKCRDLQELVLIGINVTVAGVEPLALYCPNLERLAICGSETMGDLELSCISVKCLALKRMCIKSCRISDNGMRALATGCPQLTKVKIRKCRGVTNESVSALSQHRPSLIVSLDPELPTIVIEEVATRGEVASQVEETRPVAALMRPSRIKPFSSRSLVGLFLQLFNRRGS